jgi:prolyl-tRNA editing enzyme YbaK/EbsC (Cys-tRNA(Pro) deacylase)
MSADAELSPSARVVQDALHRLGYAHHVVEFAQTTRSAREAAGAIGCQVEQIAKSLVFRTREGRRPILVIASGRNRVDEARLAGYVGEAIERPDADYVRARTGFAIGGVPPVGHAEALETYIDRDLLGLDALWAAAGTPHAVFRLTPDELVAMTRGQVVDVT